MNIVKSFSYLNRWRKGNARRERIAFSFHACCMIVGFVVAFGSPTWWLGLMLFCIWYPLSIHAVATAMKVGAVDGQVLPKPKLGGTDREITIQAYKAVRESIEVVKDSLGSIRLTAEDLKETNVYLRREMDRAVQKANPFSDDYENLKKSQRLVEMYAKTVGNWSQNLTATMSAMAAINLLLSDEATPFLFPTGISGEETPKVKVADDES